MTRLSSITFCPFMSVVWHLKHLSLAFGSITQDLVDGLGRGDLLRSLTREPGGSCHSSKTDERHAHRVEEHDEIRICHMLEQIQARGTGLIRYGDHERYDE